MANSSVQPVEIELKRAKELRIRWSDGQLGVYPLALLRRICPCAACRTEREERALDALPIVRGPDEQAKMAVAASAELVGNYGLRIKWNDGHNTGIYDYELLRSLPGGDVRPRAAGERSGSERATCA